MRMEHLKVKICCDVQRPNRGGVLVRIALCAMTLGGLDASAEAQILQQDNQQNSPNGSPLGQRQNNNNSNNNYNNDSDQRARAPANDAVPSTQIQPVQVSGSDVSSTRAADPTAGTRLRPPPLPNEFERFVTTSLGAPLPHFGLDMLLPGDRDYARPATATVPPGYILNVGDVIAISMAGSIEGSVEREIDTRGRIFLPRVGTVNLSGVRYGDLKEVLARAINTRFRGFTVDVSVRQLRGIRVYVTGYANNPGSFSVNSLSTMVNAVLAAGGPSSGGSFRSVKLYRNNKLISDFDLYQLVRGGNRSNDVVLQNEDVLYIPPVGGQVAVAGSVNAPAIYESKPGETLEQLIRYAGGPSDLADKSRAMLYRLSDANALGVQQIPLQVAEGMPARGGDIIQILSEGTLQRPTAAQSVLVRIEGEVQKPGSYYLPANTRLDDVVAKAGGFTDRAYVYGTRYERVSVRRQQGEAYRDAIRQLEIALSAAPLTSSQSIAAGERAAQQQAAREVLDRLRAAEPDGRVVLDLPPAATTLPSSFVLENNDRIVIPMRPTTVGVYGAVYRPASFSIDGAKPMKASAYLERAGGPIRAADKGAIFVVHANGEVLSKKTGALSARILPGDMIFVPVKSQSGSLWARIRDITTVIFQLGLGAATIAAINN